MKTAFLGVLCLLLTLLGPPGPAAEDGYIGVVKSVEGTATIERGAESLPVVIGMAVQRGDVVRNGRQGTVGLVFSDDTRITMGPNTEIAVDDYVFEPLEKNLSFIVRLIRGTVSFLSGQMTNLSPESVQLVMPAATIGVRGTHVLVKVD